MCLQATRGFDEPGALADGPQETDEPPVVSEQLAARAELYERVDGLVADDGGEIEGIAELVVTSGVTIKDVRRTGYDERLHLALAISSPRTSVTITLDGVETEHRAVAHEARSLEDVADGLTSASTVVVGDVHGDVRLLRRTLERLGVIQDDRRVFDGTVVQLGDLIDGRNGCDVECLRHGLEWCDVVLAGNHEAAYLGGPSFGGQPVRDDVASDLRRALRSPAFRVGYVADGVLLSHAGVLSENEDPEATLAVVEERWLDHLGRPRPRDPMLFGIDSFRGGNGVGGILWGDWRGRFHQPTPFPQIVGHSALGASEQDETERWHDIDVAGARLAVAVIDDGHISVGHSMLLR